MIEEWRSILYPFGFLASIIFGLRFFVQWFKSEKKQKSHVTSSFWKLSLAGNLLLWTHSIIQVQFPVALIQTCNGAISFRNLELIKGKNTGKGTRRVITTFLIACFSTILIFLLQGYLLYGHADWVRTPNLPWEALQGDRLSLGWHIFGFLGISLFSARFWTQWWQSEKTGESHLGASFWWMSLLGGVISLTYFTRLHDVVNMLGYGVGLIPYARNLMLLKKKPKEEKPLTEELFVFAGEHSGDLHGEKLIEALKTNYPELKIYGVGGPKMRAAGLDCIMPMEEFQVMGFYDVFLALPKLFRHFRFLKRTVLKRNSKAALFIDYPGFNLRMEKALRRAGYAGKLIHYVSPTVWAWGKGRVKTMEKNLDLLLTIFPFEKKYFKSEKLQVEYVGNPSLSSWKLNGQKDTPKEWRRNSILPNEGALLALFPGSRRGEISQNLPLQLAVCERLKKKHPDLVCALSIASPQLIDPVKAALENSSLQLDHDLFLMDRTATYPLMKNCTAALATSGTVTLELAIRSTPSVVIYDVPFINWLLVKYLFRLDLEFYCISNIISGKEIYPECIDRSLDVDAIFEKVEPLLDPSSPTRQACIQGCKEMRELLGNKHCHEEAAKRVGALLA